MRNKVLTVKESNIVARAKIEPAVKSVWDERVIALVASQNVSEDQAFQEHIIPISILTNDGTELSTLQHQEARKAIRERLIRQAYVIPQGKRGFIAITIFDYIEIDDAGNIKAKLNPTLGKYYLDLKREYALRSLPAFAKLSSTYSQQLFRYINSLKGLPEAIVTLEELHNILSTPPSLRRDFGAFRARVLEVAHREITDANKTGLFFEWEPIKKGMQKVAAIRFIFAASLLQQETAEEKARREHDEVRHKANVCWEMWEMLNKKCRPGKRSLKCQWCTTQGHVWAQNFQMENQKALLSNAPKQEHTNESIE